MSACIDGASAASAGANNCQAANMSSTESVAAHLAGREAVQAGGGDLVRVGRLQVLQRHRGLQVAQHLAGGGGGVRRGRGGGGGHREGGREVRGLEIRHGGHHAAAGHRG